MKRKNLFSDPYFLACALLRSPVGALQNLGRKGAKAAKYRRF
jgi:hypothetical protein